MDFLAPDFEQSIKRLVRQINFSPDEFALYLVQVNSRAGREKALARLKEALRAAGIAPCHLHYEEAVPSLLSDLQEQALPSPFCFLLTGLDLSIKPGLPVSPLLAHFNLARELYGEKLPHPLVLFLSDESLTTLVRTAPDFWAWRSGTYELEATRPTNELVTHFTLAHGAIQTPANLCPPMPPIPFVGRAAIRQEMADALCPPSALVPELVEGRQAQNIAGSGYDPSTGSGDDPSTGSGYHQLGTVQILSGLGGVGKTALAARIAHDITHCFPGGVLWLSLANKPTSDELWRMIAQAYQRPTGAYVATIAQELLSEYRPLLLLDNAESAPQSAKAIIEARGAATILVTTRDRSIAPLATTLPKLSRRETITLLMARLGTQPPAELADALADALGDLPLAIEIATGYIRQYRTPLDRYIEQLKQTALDQMLHLAEDASQSVPAAFDLSYNRLDQEPRLALSILALDGGDTTSLDAVAFTIEWLEGTGLDEEPFIIEWLKGEKYKSSSLSRALLGCKSLEDHSLVMRQGERYVLHPLVRRYTQENMPPEQREAIEQGLTVYYFNFSRPYWGDNRTKEEALERELSNILAAMKSAYHKQNWKQVDRFDRVLGINQRGGGILQTRGYWRALRQSREWSLEASRHLGHQRFEGIRLHNLGLLCYEAGDYELAQTYYQQAINLQLKLGNRDRAARTQAVLGDLIKERGEYGAAKRLYEESLQTLQDYHDESWIAAIFLKLGNLARQRGNYPEAQQDYQKALGLYQKLNDQIETTTTFNLLGRWHHDQSQFHEARRFYDQSLELSKPLHHSPTLMSSYYCLGKLAIDIGNYAQAEKHLKKGLQLAQKMENPLYLADTWGELGRLAYHQQNDPQAEKLLKHALDFHKQIGAIVAASYWMYHLAQLYERQERFDKALPLLQESVAIAERTGLAKLAERQAALTRVRKKMGLPTEQH